MKKQLCLLLFLVISTFQLKAQLLWEISGNGLESPSYLYGTMHIGDDRVYQFNDSLLPLFYECDLFAGELVLEQSIFSSLNLLMGMQMEDHTLADLLPKKKYAFVKRKLDKRLNEMGMLFMVNYIEQMKPIFISFILSDLELKASSGPMKDPLDLYFQKIARKKEMEVIGLETMDEQMAVFDKMPLKDQAEMLYTELSKQGQKDEMDINRLIDIYAKEDLDSLYTLTQGSFNQAMNDELLYKRNINMANRMEPHLKKKRIFVGVGAAHLPGEGGLIDLLRKKGYTLRPVNFAQKD